MEEEDCSEKSWRQFSPSGEEKDCYDDEEVRQSIKQRSREEKYWATYFLGGKGKEQKAGSSFLYFGNKSKLDLARKSKRFFCLKLIAAYMRNADRTSDGPLTTRDPLSSPFCCNDTTEHLIF